MRTFEVATTTCLLRSAMGPKLSKLVDGGSTLPMGVLYPPPAIPAAVLAKLVAARKLCPFYSPTDAADAPECPICFLRYPATNATACCHQPLCSDCFVQLKRVGPVYASVLCPYCTAV